MAWFKPEFELFLEDLKANNNREWFQANKKRYESFVKEPFKGFVSEMILRMQHYDAECRIEAKDAIFRINRDIRFSKDKTPYKTLVSAVVGKGGKKETTMSGMYIEMGHEHLRVYGGVYMPDKDQLYKIRQEILYNQEAFKKCLNDRAFRSTYGEIRGEKNKRLPPELAEIQDQQPLIANKQFYYYATLSPELITSDSLMDEVFKTFEAGIPMRDFLMTPLLD
ncbi:MAG: DUF2461 domain-containing protein [Salibacteraceae bacterium]